MISLNIRIRTDSIIYEVKTIRPLSLPVLFPPRRTRRPSYMQQRLKSTPLTSHAGPAGVHPHASPLILFLARSVRPCCVEDVAPTIRFFREF